MTGFVALACGVGVQSVSWKVVLKILACPWSDQFYTNPFLLIRKDAALPHPHECTYCDPYSIIGEALIADPNIRRGILKPNKVD